MKINIPFQLLSRGPTPELVSREEFKYFLAGFIEGEGSLCVSIKSNKTSRFGYAIDPEFYLYQHLTGKPILEAAKMLFGAGRVYLKNGSETVYVFSITNRRVIEDRVLPYFIDFVIPMSCKYQDFFIYRSIILGLARKQHGTLEGFLELLRLVYELNPYSKGKDRSHTYEELKNIILRDYTPTNNKIV